ncbi:MAG: hypothetical protein ABIO80_09195 [Sphingomicrobium sp.]
MSASPIGELALGAQPLVASSGAKQPGRRTAVAKADNIAQPEPR